MSLVDRIRRLFRRSLPDRSTPEPNPERQDIATASEATFGPANLLIGQYGTDARAHAARLLQDAVREDDPEATADWLAIECAIALLTNDSAATLHRDMRARLPIESSCRTVA